MKSFFSSAAAMLLMTAQSHASPEESMLEAGGVYAKILGQSGKIVLGTTENPSQDPKSVTIEFDSMYERDIDGNEIGNEGQSKHSFNSFASQDFKFGNMYNATLGDAKASAIDFVATLIGDAKLTVTAYMITEEGDYELNDDEAYELSVGSLKFNVQLEKWPFCTEGGEGDTKCSQGNAPDSVGEFLDLNIAIRGKDDKAVPLKDSGNSTYSLGGNVTVDLSKSVQVDGQWQPMTEGYPLKESKGSKEIFTFRFPKFSSSVTYDPIIDGFLQDEDSSGKVDGNSAAGLKPGFWLGVSTLMAYALQFAN